MDNMNNLQTIQTIGLSLSIAIFGVMLVLKSVKKIYDNSDKIFNGLFGMLYEVITFSIKGFVMVSIISSVMTFGTNYYKTLSSHKNSLVVFKANEMSNNYKNFDMAQHIKTSFLSPNVVKNSNVNQGGFSSNNFVSQHNIILDQNKPVLIVFRFDEIYTSQPSVTKFENVNTFVNYVINTFDDYNKNVNNVEVAIILSSGGGNALFFERAYSNLMRLSNHGFHTYALVDTICASGCYMMACACKKIIASNSSTIGSIGVFTKRYNGANFSQMVGIEEMIFKTSNKKGDVPFLGTPDKESLDHIQMKINKTMKKFTSIVKKGRPDADPALFDADIMYAEDALKNKLVDSIEMTDDWLKSKESTHNILKVVESQQSPPGSSENLIQSVANLLNNINEKIENKNSMLS